MRRLTGPLMISIGIVHSIVGIALGWKVFGDIIADGIFNAVDPHYDRNAIFWFMLTGFLMIMLGQLVSTIERKHGNVQPKYLGWEFLIFSIIICITMPVSGGWLVLALSIYMIIGARKN